MTLEEKRNNKMKDVRKSIDTLSLQEEMINKQKAEYMKKMDLLRNYDSFDKKEAKEIIEYLVSKTEGKNYSVEKLHVDTILMTNDKTLVFEYTFLYLVEEEKKEEALKEIKSKYNVVESNGKSIIENSSIMREDDISDNYVKLAFYNRYSDRSVKFTDQREAHVISIDIKDERYNYINSFVEQLLFDRLDRNNYNLPMGAIKLKADNFALKQKNKKKLILESE